MIEVVLSAAEEYIKKLDCKNENELLAFRLGFLQGAKWQQQNQPNKKP